MRILMLASRFHPHLGGVEKHLWELSGELTRRGHLLTLVTERYDDRLAREESVRVDGGEVRVVRISAADQKGSSFAARRTLWPALFRLRELVREADLVHCHDFSVFVFWYLPLRFWYPRKRVYVTFHGWEGACPPERAVVFLRRVTERLVRGNICIGDFIGKWYGTRADHVLYGGVRSSAVQPPGVTGGGAVFVGRLAGDTGIMTYLGALAMLREEGAAPPLTVCGDGPLRPECEAFAAQNRLEVRFLGFVADPAPHLARASLVFVSGYLAILEAMSQGKLVFSVFDNPLKEDYLRLMPGSGDAMFVAGSAGELAAQLRRAADDPGLASGMAEKAFLLARGWSWQRVADTYETLWSARVGQPPAGAPARDRSLHLE